jgi:hypothetical protein
MSNRKVFLKKDHKEKFTLKRGWFVNAWRLVDEDGDDVVQPWFDKRKDAIKFAKSEGYELKMEIPYGK